MTVVIKGKESKEDTQNTLKSAYQKIIEKRRKRKLKVLQATSGAVVFDATKTPLEIQKEMRSEWD